MKLHVFTSGGKLFALYAVQTLMIALAEYVLITVMGIGVIPVTLSYISGAMGISSATAFLDAVVMWLFPSLFFVLCFTALTIVCGYQLYKLIRRMFASSIQKQKDAMKQEQTADETNKSKKSRKAV